MVKKVFNFILFGFVGILLLFLAYMIFSIVSENQEKADEKREFQETQVALYGDMTTLCENVSPGGVGDFVIAGDARPLILTTDTTEVHEIMQTLPADRVPSGEADVDFVMCLPSAGTGTRVEIGRCPYEGTEREAVRYRVDADITVIDPVSGTMVMTDVLEGAEPPGCPFSIEESGATQAVVGGSPTTATIATWIELQGFRSVASGWDADLLSLCESPPEAEDSLAPMEASEDPKILILESGTQSVHEWMGNLGDAWIPDASEDVDFVVCAPPINADTVEDFFAMSCEFMVSSGGDFQGSETIEVYQRAVTVVVVDPSSGEALAELVVEGSPRSVDALGGGGPGCPQTIGADEFEAIYGDYPTGRNFQGAFNSQFVN